MSKEKFNIFTILSAIADNKSDITDHPLFEKTYNIYMINKWLSMNASGVIAAYYGDQMHNLSKKDHFYFVRELIINESGESTYFKYAKGNKKGKNLKIIMDYFNISDEKANEIVNILDQKQLRLIKQYRGGRK